MKQKIYLMFGFLLIFLMGLTSAIVLNSDSNRGVWTTFYSDLDNDVRVFYEVFSPLRGVGHSKLIAVYDPVEQSCRLPNSCELNENKYLPMTCIN